MTLFRAYWALPGLFPLPVEILFIAILFVLLTLVLVKTGGRNGDGSRRVHHIWGIFAFSLLTLAAERVSVLCLLDGKFMHTPELAFFVSHFSYYFGLSVLLLLLSSTSALFLSFVKRIEVRLRAVDPSRCTQCRYSLIGLEDQSPCPECGRIRPSAQE